MEKLRVLSQARKDRTGSAAIQPRREGDGSGGEQQREVPANLRKMLGGARVGS